MSNRTRPNDNRHQSYRNHQGHFARKRFGQNFLHDDNIIEDIVTAIAPKKEQALVEIGPGLAALTLPVSQYLDHLTVIEIDRDLALRLSNNSLLKTKLTIIEQDVMTVDFTELSTRMGQSLRVFGNLPYNISTPLMFHLFEYAHVICDMNFMLQKEVVNRLVASPNTKDYGRLSIIAQYYCQIIPVLDVPAFAFKPAPKVDSAVVKLIPHKKLPYPVKNIKALSHITAQAFNQRRKTVRNSLKNLFSPDTLTKFNIHLDARAENLTLQQYCELADAYTLINELQ